MPSTRSTRTTTSPAAPAATTPAAPPAPAAPSAPPVAPVSVPEVMPPPQPERATATYVPRSAQRDQLSCYTISALGAPKQLDLARVFTPDGLSCAVGSRTQLFRRLNALVELVEEVPGAPVWDDVGDAAEKLANSRTGVGSTGYRQQVARANLVEHVITLLLHHGVLLRSVHCVLLHGALDIDSGGSFYGSRSVPGGKGKGPGSGGSGSSAQPAINLTGAAPAGALGGSGSGSGIGAGVEDTAESTQHDKDLVHLVSQQRHTPEGETDAMKEDHATTYYERFQTLVKDVRALGFPDLQFFTVAITGTTSRLPYLDKVRDAQLHAGSSARTSGVWVVDAFGLPMFTDGLHLLTNAQVEVGERMALQVFAATEPSPPTRKGTQVTNDGCTRGWVRGDALVSKAEIHFDRIAALAKSRRESTQDIVSQVTNDVAGQAMSVTSRTGDSRGAPTHQEPSTSGAATDGGHHGKRGFVKAESSKVQFRSFARIFPFLEPAPASGTCLLVLGHGVGTCVLAGALLYNMRHIQGMELMQGGLDEAHALLSAYSDYSSTAATVSDEMAHSLLELPLQRDVGSARTPTSSIAFLEGGISEAQWSGATLVYAVCCTFDDLIMSDVATQCRNLANGARVVTIGKPLPLVHVRRRVEEKTVAKEEFRVAWQCQVRDVCGRSSVAFVHHRGVSPS